MKRVALSLLFGIVAWIVMACSAFEKTQYGYAYNDTTLPQSTVALLVCDFPRELIRSVDGRVFTAGLLHGIPASVYALPGERTIVLRRTINARVVGPTIEVQNLDLKFKANLKAGATYRVSSSGVVESP